MSRPKRKICVPKRYTTNEDKIEENKKKYKNNKHCIICDILIDSCYMEFFEINKQIYCDVCYNDLENEKTKINIYNTTLNDTTLNDTNINDTTINDTNINDTTINDTTLNNKPKLRFIIMNKNNPNLINIINNKILQTNLENINKQIEKDNKIYYAENDDEDNDEDNNEKYNYKEYNDEEYDEEYNDEEYNDEEYESDKEDDYVEDNDKEDNYVQNYDDTDDDDDDDEDSDQDKTYEKDKNYKDKNKEKDKDKEKDNINKSNSIDYYENDFNNLFIKSILNRINNIDKIDKINKVNKNCCAPIIINNKQKNKGNKNKDDRYDIDKDDNNDNTLEYEWLGKDIKDIDDLIRIGKTYNPKKRKRHNLNLKKLNKLVEPLIELKNMIGMKEVKKIIFDQIIYYLQNLDDKNVDMLHTVIVGPPGVGKTQLTYIIAKIYNKLGFLKTDKVVCAKRDDLIGEYIGQTAPKTRKVIESALGGVLLLDEVYALSPNSEKDFAREAIDMINVYLSEHCHDFVCVIAGYKKPTYENFLAHNEGLARRFTHHFEIKGYNAEELTLIFKKYLEEQKWGLSATVEEMKPIIEKNLKIFPNFGGDMTTLFACCKKTHSKRLLLIPTEEELNLIRKKIHIDDIEKGIKLFIDIKSKNGDDIEDKDKFVHMYS